MYFLIFFFKKCFLLQIEEHPCVTIIFLTGELDADPLYGAGLFTPPIKSGNNSFLQHKIREGRFIKCCVTFQFNDPMD
jgi:hypothetical protein